MTSDNISGAGSNFIIRIFLIPGMIFQWFIYIGFTNVGAGKGYAKVRSQTRIARSRIMTWAYSIVGWGLILLYFLSRD